jgi:hypothetical protein
LGDQDSINCRSRNLFSFDDGLRGGFDDLGFDLDGPAAAASKPPDQVPLRSS